MEISQYLYMLAAVLGVLALLFLLAFLLPSLLLEKRLSKVRNRLVAPGEKTDGALNSIFEKTGILEQFWIRYSNTPPGTPVAEIFQPDTIVASLHPELFQRLANLLAIIGMLGAIFGLLVGLQLIHVPGVSPDKPLHGAWEVLIESGLLIAVAAITALLQHLMINRIEAAIEKITPLLDAPHKPGAEATNAGHATAPVLKIPQNTPPAPAHSAPKIKIAQSSSPPRPNEQQKLPPRTDGKARLTDEARQKLKHTLGNLHSLPAMPVIAQKLLALPLHTEQGEAQLLRLIEQDPQISAKLIGLANSPIHGLTRKVSALSDVVLLFGMPKIKTVAIGIASLSRLSQLSAGEHFKPQDLWLHSMTVAFVMHAIAGAMPADIRPRDDQIFLAGLLHDIGYMALHYVDASISNELHYRLRQQTDRPILEIELETLGITHCEIGAQLALHWNLPPDIVAVLAHHHSPYASEVRDEHHLVRLASLTEKILPDLGIAERIGSEIEEREWQDLGIAQADIEAILNQADELSVQAAQLGEML